MTEEQAKEKWCPFGRVIGAHADAGNIQRLHTGYNRLWRRDSQEMEPAKASACIASRCMAWRWTEEKPILDIDLATSDVEKGERTGYCGLASKPDYP